MIRNLKILIAAAMALAAFGVIGASSAQGAEFHCGAEPCMITVKPDGTPGPTGKTAHHVFVFKQLASSVALTCQQASGHGTSATKTFKHLTLTKVLYSSCNVAGEAATVSMNGCEYSFDVGGVHDATAQINCPVGKSIQIEVPATGCVITIGGTGVLGGGLTFHDAETNGTKKTEVTMEITLTEITATVNSKCPGGLKEGVATCEYTTGNAELTAEKDGTEIHTNLWYE